MRAAYLGPVGSYSYRAVRDICPDGTPVACRDFDEVFAAAETGECDCAVVPIENSVEGGVSRNMDLLIGSPLVISGEYELAIDNRVFTLAGHGEITRILSHPQAYGQCRETLKKLFPNAEFLPTPSTTGALAALDAHTAAVAGSDNAGDGFEVSACVNDHAGNTTRFYLLARAAPDREERAKISMVFEARDRPGGLLRILSVLDEYGLDMTSIQSRPHKTQLGRYFFFVDVTGDLREKRTARAVEEMRRISPFFKLLGNYGKISAPSPAASSAEIAPCVSLEKK